MDGLAQGHIDRSELRLELETLCFQDELQTPESQSHRTIH